MLIAAGYDILIPDRTARLRDLANAAPVRTLDIVAEWEESVTCERSLGETGEPCAFFFLCKLLGADGKELLPLALIKNISALLVA